MRDIESDRRAGMFSYEWAVPVAGTPTFAIVHEPVNREPHGMTANAWDTLIQCPGTRLAHSTLLDDQPSLFVRFAALDPDDDDAILGFANRFGSLTNLSECEVVLPDRRCGGERLVAWRKAIRAMRRLVELWSWIRKGDREALGKCFTWIDDRAAARAGRLGKTGWWYAYRYGSPDHAHCRVTPQPQLGPDDLVAAARVHLAREITEGLARGQPVLRLTLTNFELGVAPRDLHAAMYIQFARAVSGDTEPRQCDGCGEWFLASPHQGRGKRTDARHCGPTCRQRAKRTRDAVPAKAAGKKGEARAARRRQSTANRKRFERPKQE